MTSFYKKLIKGKSGDEEKKDAPASISVSDQLKKIQDQLSYLERKVDQLLAQSFRRGGGGGGRPHYQGGGGHNRGDMRNNRDAHSGGNHRRWGNPQPQREDRKEDRENFVNKQNRNFPH